MLDSNYNFYIFLDSAYMYTHFHVTFITPSYVSYGWQNSWKINELDVNIRIFGYSWSQDYPLGLYTDFQVIPTIPSYIYDDDSALVHDTIMVHAQA